MTKRPRAAPSLVHIQVRASANMYMYVHLGLADQSAKSPTQPQQWRVLAPSPARASCPRSWCPRVPGHFLREAIGHPVKPVESPPNAIHRLDFDDHRRSAPRCNCDNCSCAHYVRMCDRHGECYNAQDELNTSNARCVSLRRALRKPATALSVDSAPSNDSRPRPGICT
jgi:hypothetical protein